MVISILVTVVTQDICVIVVHCFLFCLHTIHVGVLLAVFYMCGHNYVITIIGTHRVQCSM